MGKIFLSYEYVGKFCQLQITNRRNNIKSNLADITNNPHNVNYSSPFQTVLASAKSAATMNDNVLETNNTPACFYRKNCFKTES
jgi:hypothetical protein